MTFSIVARCARTGQMGMAVTSSSVCVASRCAWVQAGAGVIATQNLTDPGLGPIGLELLRQGRTAQQVLDMLVAGDPGQAYRQLQVLDASGEVAQHTGGQALPTVASARSTHCAAAGNLLANTGIPQAMLQAFESRHEQPLAQRLLAALQAGLAQGGETRVLRSAGITVVDTQNWPIVDLRVDDSALPLDVLDVLWRTYEPLMPGYVSRAKAPHLAVV